MQLTWLRSRTRTSWSRALHQERDCSCRTSLGWTISWRSWTTKLNNCRARQTSTTQTSHIWYRSRNQVTNSPHLHMVRYLGRRGTSTYTIRSSHRHQHQTSLITKTQSTLAFPLPKDSLQQEIRTRAIAEKIVGCLSSSSSPNRQVIRGTTDLDLSHRLKWIRKCNTIVIRNRKSLEEYKYLLPRGEHSAKPWGN